MEFQNLRRVVAKISVVGLASGILYLWAYWSKFGINIFSYASILDLVNSAIIPLGTGLFFAAIYWVGYMLISTWDDGARAGIIERKTTTIGEISFPRPSILDGVLFLVYLVAIFMLMMFLANRYPLYFVFPFKVLIFPVLFALVVGSVVQFLIRIGEFDPLPEISNTNAVQLLMQFRGFNPLPEISNTNTRFALIVTLLFAPPYAGLRGEYDAESLLMGRKSTLYEVSSGHKYIGYVSGYFFFLSSDNSKITIKNAKFHKTLELTSLLNNKPPKTSP